MEDDKNWGEYYLAIEEKGETILYKSEPYALDEISIINLIKICLVQKRAVSVGRKILAVYLDTTQHKKEETNEVLKKIGVKIQENDPIKSKRTKSR